MIELSHPIDVSLRIGARSILAGAIVVFTVALLGGNLPNDPEGGALTNEILVPLQIALLVATCVGLVLSFRWMAVAAGTVAFAGTGITIISALQYESPTPIFVAAAFLLPAVMMWLDWQCSRNVREDRRAGRHDERIVHRHVVRVDAVYDHFGPTHPESTPPNCPTRS